MTAPATKAERLAAANRTLDHLDLMIDSLRHVSDLLVIDRARTFNELEDIEAEPEETA